MKCVWALPVFVGLVGLPGCGKKSTVIDPSKVVASGTVPAGWQLVKADNDPISIGLPPGWESPQVTAGEFHDAASKLWAKSPDLAKKQADTEKIAANSQLKLQISSKTKVDGYHATCVLIYFPQQFKSDLKTTASDRADRVRNKGIQVEQTSLDLPAGPCEMVQFEQVSKVSNKPVTDRWYFWMIDGHLYNLACGCSKGDTQDESTIEQMAQTLKLTP